MPSSFAYVALISWPLVVFVLCRSLEPAKALLASVIGGYLLLPHGVGFDFPLLPVLDKNSIPALSFLAFVWFGRPAQRRRADRVEGKASEQRWHNANSTAGVYTQELGPQRGFLWVRWSERAILSLFFLGPVLTAINNNEVVVFGYTVLPSISMYDTLSMIQSSVIVLLPYAISRTFIRNVDDIVLLLAALLYGAVIYTIPALLEIRLSPQISRWVYGFLSQSFLQAMRDAGFRPVVFLQHGLWLAIFFCMAVLAAFALWRQTRAAKWLMAGVWVFVVLGLSRSLGAMVIALAAVPLVLLLKPKTQILLAGMMAMVILAYPALRGAGMIPVQDLTNWADSVSQDRAGSLTFRFQNEDQLLARANQKPLTGWGGWGRGRIYDASGEQVSVTDGMWIIFITDSGWLGYIAHFGLLTLPLIVLAMRRKSVLATPAVAGLAMVLCVNLVDLIPNATLTPITWLVAGALMGALRGQVASGSQVLRLPQQRGRRVVTYSRPR